MKNITSKCDFSGPDRHSARGVCVNPTTHFYHSISSLSGVINLYARCKEHNFSHFMIGGAPVLTTDIREIDEDEYYMHEIHNS